MKFLCDEMLAGLGRWLRIAGYDTEFIQDGKRDELILERALREGRLLLTRDRHFLEMKRGGDSVIYLSGNSLEECVHELNERFQFNWLYRPFCRCLVCNSLIEKVPSDAQSDQFWYCPKCKKNYWEGSHTENMLKQLQKWQDSL